MAGGGADNIFIKTCLAHQLLRFYAVLSRILFKVQVVEQSYVGPKISLIAIAKLVGKVAHNTLYGQGVAQMKGLLIIFCQECPGVITC